LLSWRAYSHSAEIATGANGSVTNGSTTEKQNGRSVHTRHFPTVTIEYAAVHGSGAPVASILFINNVSYENPSALQLVEGDFMRTQT
jgi:hypothetical protein